MSLPNSSCIENGAENDVQGVQSPYSRKGTHIWYQIKVTFKKVFMYSIVYFSFAQMKQRQGALSKDAFFE